ncbi:MAG: molybdenum cofactor biosynthesis protein [Phycisphaerae bacterium]|nr:molybdenum cofactor biosynthesis protein [Phycisphaerae bacterium]|tara:strand:+ start:316 stop:834 length:519 start_codon:yes stop_codon:yes gene_type:complete
MTHQLSSTHGSCTLITISDSRTQATDDSGDVIEQKLIERGHLILQRAIVSDDVSNIQSQIREALAMQCASQFIIMTGGSGIGQRDCTPEAVKEFNHIPLEGFGEMFRLYSERDIGPRAMLSRATAGILTENDKRVPFFILPGSTHAVTLAMDACILPIIGHVLDLCHTKEQT